MDITKFLTDVKSGAISIEDAKESLARLPFDDLGYAVVDHHRQLRNGCSEVIYCASKTPEQIVGIIQNMQAYGTPNILATRAGSEAWNVIQAAVPEAVYHQESRLVTIVRQPPAKNKGRILVLTGGTSDIPVAEEAAITAEFLGNVVDRLYDVGVAGLHRLLHRLDLIRKASVVVVVAGMEGALASVAGGLTDKPVIAVPTSVGYGASFGGISALLCMLNSCASGVGVVNIDNGFGAGYLADSINQLGGKSD